MKPQRKRVRFEHHPSRVVFDPSSAQFVVTWSKCGASSEKRLESRRNPMSWMPSVSAMASLYDRGCIPKQQMLHAAKAIGRAWDSGDRIDLDTDRAKKAAEMVRDLASIEAGASDIGQAMCRLVDEIAKVKFSGTPCSEFSDSALAPIGRAISECFGIDGFASWPAASQRRRFLYCLNRRERTKVAYSLAALFFGTGSCPILSMSDRRALRAAAYNDACGDMGEKWVVHMSPEFASSFFRNALSAMASAKAAGLDSIGSSMTQQQLADSVSLPLKQGENNAVR